MIFLLIVAAVALGVYFGYLIGVRVERGRAERIAELRQEQVAPARRGVRLTSIRVRR